MKEIEGGVFKDWLHMIEFSITLNRFNFPVARIHVTLDNRTVESHGRNIIRLSIDTFLLMKFEFLDYQVNISSFLLRLCPDSCLSISSVPRRLVPWTLMLLTNEAFSTIRHLCDPFRDVLEKRSDGLFDNLSWNTFGRSTIKRKASGPSRS